MGFTREAAPRAQVLAVATVKGRATGAGGQHPKSRVWVLEDRTAVLITPAPVGQGNPRLVRTVFQVERSRWHEQLKLLEIEVVGNSLTGELAGGELLERELEPAPAGGVGNTLTELLQVDARGCGCGMGAVGNAGPIEGQYDVVRVRKPDWHEVLP